MVFEHLLRVDVTSAALLLWGTMNPKLSLFPITSEVNSRGCLTIGGVDAAELARRYGTPLYVFDEATLRARCRDFKREFAGRYNNTVIAYAGKAFMHGALAAILKEEGFGLDVVSAGEWYIAESGGFPPERVYFHGNNKSADELKLALEHGIGRIVVDNLDELGLLAGLAAESGCTPKILLRITPGVDAHTHGHLTTGTVSSKFGIPLPRAEEAISRAMSCASVDLVGLHFHLGSMIDELPPYLDAMDLVLNLVAGMGQKYGFELKELDIGGGFGVQYTLDNLAPEIGLFANSITEHLIERCRNLNLTPPQLTIEPGRAIVAQAGVALYCVGTIKEVGESLYVAVDGGMSDNVRPALYEARYEVLSAEKASDSEMAQVAIVGRSCESGDILIKQTMMARPVAGDIVAIPVCGAYCLPMASNYNALPKPAIALVSNGTARLIRRRETWQDLMRNDVV